MEYRITKPRETTLGMLARLNDPHELKICSLCGTLNCSNNEACFNCHWSGEFETDILAISIRVTLAFESCPEFAPTFKRKKRGLMGYVENIVEKVRMLFLRMRRRIDIRA